MRYAFWTKSLRVLGACLMTGILSLHAGCDAGSKPSVAPDGIPTTVKESNKKMEDFMNSQKPAKTPAKP